MARLSFTQPRTRVSFHLPWLASHRFFHSSAASRPELSKWATAWRDTKKRGEMGDFGGGSLEHPRPWLGSQRPGARLESAELHGAATRALRRRRGRAGARCQEGQEQSMGATDTSWSRTRTCGGAAAASCRVQKLPSRSAYVVRYKLGLLPCTKTLVPPPHRVPRCVWCMLLSLLYRGSGGGWRRTGQTNRC